MHASLLHATARGDVAAIAQLLRGSVPPLAQQHSPVASASVSDAPSPRSRLGRLLTALADCEAAATWARDGQLAAAAEQAALRSQMREVTGALLDVEERRTVAAHLSGMLDEELDSAPCSALAAAVCIVELLRPAPAATDADADDEFDPVSTAAAWLSPPVSPEDVPARPAAGLAMAVAGLCASRTSFEQQQQQTDVGGGELRGLVGACVSADPGLACHAVALCAAAAAAAAGPLSSSVCAAVLEPALTACGLALEWPSRGPVSSPARILVDTAPPPVHAATMAAGSVRSALEAGRALGRLAASADGGQAPTSIQLRGSAFGLPGQPDDRVDTSLLELPLSACGATACMASALQQQARALAFALGAASVSVEDVDSARRVLVLRRGLACALQLLHEAAATAAGAPAHAASAPAHARLRPSAPTAAATPLASVDHDDVLAIVGLKGRQHSAGDDDEGEAQLRFSDDDSGEESSVGSEHSRRRPARRPRFNVMAALEQVQGLAASPASSAAVAGGGSHAYPAAVGGSRVHELPVQHRRALAWVSDACSAFRVPALAAGLSLPMLLAGRLLVQELAAAPSSSAPPHSLPAAMLQCELVCELLSSLLSRDASTPSSSDASTPSSSGSSSSDCELVSVRSLIDCGLPGALTALVTALVPLLEVARQEFAAAVATHENAARRRQETQADGARLRRIAVREAVGRVEASLRLGGRFAERVHADAATRVPVWSSLGGGGSDLPGSPPALLQLRADPARASSGRARVGSLSSVVSDQEDEEAAQPRRGCALLPAAVCPPWLEQGVTVAYGEGLLQATALGSLQVLQHLAVRCSSAGEAAATTAQCLLAALAAPLESAAAPLVGGDTPAELLDRALAHLQRCAISTSHAAVASSLCALSDAVVVLVDACYPQSGRTEQRRFVRAACVFALYTCPARETLPDALLARALLQMGVGAAAADGGVQLAAPVFSGGSPLPGVPSWPSSPRAALVQLLPQEASGDLVGPEGAFAAHLEGLVGSESDLQVPQQVALLAALAACVAQLLAPKMLPASILEGHRTANVPSDEDDAPSSDEYDARSSGSIGSIGSSSSDRDSLASLQPNNEADGLLTDGTFRHPVFELVCHDNALAILTIIVDSTARLLRHLSQLVSLPEEHAPVADRSGMAGRVHELEEALLIRGDDPTSASSAQMPADSLATSSSNVTRQMRCLLVLLRCTVCLAASLISSDLRAAPLPAQGFFAKAVSEELLQAGEAVLDAASLPQLCVPNGRALSAAVAQLSSQLHMCSKAIDAAVSARIAAIASNSVAEQIRSAALLLTSQVPKTVDACLDCPEPSLQRSFGRSYARTSSRAASGLRGPYVDLLVWQRLLLLPQSFSNKFSNGVINFGISLDPSSIEVIKSSPVNIEPLIAESCTDFEMQHLHQSVLARTSSSIPAQNFNPDQLVAAYNLQFQQISAVAAIQMSHISSVYQYAAMSSLPPAASARRTRSSSRSRPSNSSNRKRSRKSSSSRRQRDATQSSSSDQDGWGGSEWEDGTSR